MVVPRASREVAGLERFKEVSLLGKVTMRTVVKSCSGLALTHCVRDGWLTQYRLQRPLASEESEPVKKRKPFPCRHPFEAAR